MMFLMFLGILFSVAAVSAAPLPSVIEAEEGDDVWLPCQQHPEVNLTGSLVEWTKDGRQNIVHVNRHGYDYLEDQKKEFKGRTSLSHPGLNRGDATLKLSPVRWSDNGTYRCYVKKRNANHYITLRVVEKKVQTERPEDDLTTTRAPEVIKSDEHGRNVMVATRVGILSTLFVIFFLLVGFLVLRMYRNDKNFRMMLSGWRNKEEVPVEQTEPDPQQQNRMNQREEKSKDLDSTVGDSDNES